MEMEERLERVEKKLDQLLMLLRAGASHGVGHGDGDGRRATPPSSNGRGLEVASDADLDGPRGDPEVRFTPRRWTGGDNKGRRYSECEPEFLEMLAEALEWFAQRDDESGATDKNGNPRGRWSRLDASRARGWAQRKRTEGGGASHAGGPMNGASNGRSNGTPRTGAGAVGNGRSSARASARSVDEDALATTHGSDEDIPF